MRQFLGITLILAITGCVPIPVGDGARQSARFGDTALSQVEKEATNRNDVLRLIGEPDARSDDDRTFFFGWSHSNALYPWIIPFAPGAGGVVSASAGFALLTIEFDEAGVITRRTFEPDSQAYILYPMGALVRDLPLIEAPEGKEAGAKIFQLPADRCGIYVYGSGPLPLASVSLDNRTVVSALAGMSRSYYFLIEPMPGRHLLKATNPGPQSDEPVASLDIECDAGTNVFVNVRRRWGFGDTSSVVERIDDREGRQAILERKRILTKYGVFGY